MKKQLLAFAFLLISHSPALASERLLIEAPLYSPSGHRVMIRTTPSQDLGDEGLEFWGPGSCYLEYKENSGNITSNYDEKKNSMIFNIPYQNKFFIFNLRITPATCGDSRNEERYRLTYSLYPPLSFSHYQQNVTPVLATMTKMTISKMQGGKSVTKDLYEYEAYKNNS